MSTALVRWTLASLLTALVAGCRRQAPEHPLVTAQADAVHIKLDDVADRRAHFYTYKHEGKNVNFFIRTDGEGAIRAHFDACYSCYKYRRGYVQEANQVVCIACRIGYDLAVPIWDFVGPCVPITLKCQIQNSAVILPVSALEKGARYF